MEKTILKQFIQYVSLNVMGMIGLSCYILADTFFVAKALGAKGLAALNFSIAIYCIINATGLMLGMGGATKYALLKPKNKDYEANNVFTHTLFLGVIIGIFYMLMGMFFTTPLAIFLGADISTLTMTTTYLKIILCFSPFFITNNILLAFVRNDNAPKLAMVGMLFGSFSNVVLDYVFMFPLAMGMSGAAFATGLAPIISICLLCTHFQKKKHCLTIVKARVTPRTFGTIFSLGISAFITEVSSAVVLIVFNLVLLGLSGTTAVAAYGIVANIALVIIAIFTGISQGLQPLVSYYYSKAELSVLIKLFFYGVIAALLVAIFAYLLGFIFCSEIVTLFNNEQNIVLAQLAQTGIKLYFIGFFFAGLNIVSTAFLSAINKPRFAFIISIARGCVLIIPFVFLLSKLFAINGVWLSFSVTEVITLLLTLSCFIICKPFQK